MYSVLKFGGKSFAGPELLEQALAIISHESKPDHKPVLVFSAINGMTQKLEEMAITAARGLTEYESIFEEFCAFHIQFARQILQGNDYNKTIEKLGSQHAALKTVLAGVFILREVSPRTKDYILSFGEFNACLIVEGFLNSHSLKAIFCDSRKLISTDHTFGNAQVDLELSIAQIVPYFQALSDSIPIVPGFTGATAGGLFTTLGRGSSDYTASILATALKAGSITIWSTVDGILSADPDRVSRAITIPEISYDEALEMAQVGSRRIFPKAIQTAAQTGIPIYLRNIQNPDNPGTLIAKGPFRNQKKMIKGITLRPKVMLCQLNSEKQEDTRAWLKDLEQIDVIPLIQFQMQALGNLSLVFDQSSLSKSQIKALDRSQETALDYTIIKDLALLSITGDEMSNYPGVFGKMFEILGKNGVNIISLVKAGADHTLSCIILSKDADKAINALHEGFFLSNRQVIHLYIAGTGLIGGTLLKQIQKQSAYLFENRQLEMRLVGLTNSKKQIFNPKGISLEQWESKLNESQEEANAKSFVTQMQQFNLRNSIFIDCTPKTDFADLYLDCLGSNISVSTPNKLAASGPADRYYQLKQTAQLQGVRFAFETNVGAGLPVINTLNDLLHSGDQILQIEGVLSGSMSFIFNKFQQGGSFSEAIAGASAQGLTEPDPRDDIFGLDFCRKLVILAREAGWNADLETVQTESFLSEECLNAQSIPEFLEAIKNMDGQMANLRSEAQTNNQVLRMVGKVNAEQAVLSLEAFDQTHPFYGLSGSDNMIVFTTERYHSRPLVIRGPGAGAEVTAAGIFAEIISIANVL